MAEFNPEITDPDADKSENTERINCIKCAYYEVTWDPESPHGCVLFGFKGKRMPSEIVRETTGRQCPSFIPKIKK